MKLSLYLILHGIGPTEFARRINVRSRMTIHRYITGDRIPRPEVMARIVRVTKGAVTPADFANDNHGPKGVVWPKACPEQNNHPWRRRERELCEKTERRLQKMLAEEPREGDRMSPPLRQAVDVLGERVTTDKQQRHFRLDHRPTDARTLVRLANEILSEQDKPLIQYPGVNPILD